MRINLPAGRYGPAVTLALAAAALGVVVGCASRRPVDSAPEELVVKPWFNRGPADPYPDPAETTVAGLAAALGCDPGPAQVRPAAGKPLEILVLSGGGKYGAYTAGLLNGWTASGTRPQFDVVTGISSGALTAVYAFLGPQYDPQLKHYFTELSRRELYHLCPLRAPWTGAIASEAPLARIVHKEVTPQLMDELRQAYGCGRRLFVATTNVMAQRVTVWDVTALAASGRPDAPDLVAKVILASTCIPGFVPPVEFDVTVNGCRYRELHADAGNAVQGFVRTADGIPPGSNLYNLTAGKLYLDPLKRRPGLFGAVGGTVSASLYALFRADMMNLYTLAAVTRSRFLMVALPAGVKVAPGSLNFDRDDLQLLYRVGYQMAAGGISWRTVPPGVMPDEQTVPRTGTDFVAP
jgi:hypothetical protein